jgi:hypothetical protein
MNGTPMSIRLGGLIEIGEDSDTVMSESGMGKLEIR